MDPQPSSDELRAYYTLGYMSSDEPRTHLQILREWIQRTARLWASGARAKSQRRFILNVANNSVGSEPRVLEVGCGFGALLAELRGLGWDVVGIEPNVTVSQWVASRLQVPVLNTTFENACFPDSSFSLVVMAHVLEHHFDPFSILAKARQLLDPGGLLFVEVPNTLADSAPVSMQKTPHLYFFTCDIACHPGGGRFFASLA